MSKHSRKKARKRKIHRKPITNALCQNCGSTYPATPEALLSALAAALNACDEAGIGTRLRHGIVYTSRGYVLPLKDGIWGARTMNYTEFSGPALADADLDDD